MGQTEIGKWRNLYFPHFSPLYFVLNNTRCTINNNCDLSCVFKNNVFFENVFVITELDPDEFVVHFSFVLSYNLFDVRSLIFDMEREHLTIFIRIID